VAFGLIAEKIPHKSAANLTYKILDQFLTKLRPFTDNIHVILGGVVTKELQEIPVTGIHYIPYCNIAKRGLLYILTHILYLTCAFFKTCKVIRKNKEINVLISLGEHWSSGLVALLAGKLTKRHAIIHFIGSITIPLIFLRKRTKVENVLLKSAIMKVLSTLENIILKYSDAIITVTPLLRDLYGTKYSYKMFTIPWSIDSSVFHPKRSNAKLRQEYNGQHVLLYVGRLSPEKGLEYLFRALRKVTSQYPNTILLIIGEGSYRKELELIVNDLNLKKNVYFLGFKNKYEIVEFLSIADMFVLPSLTEYAPVAIREAMACGVPVIATKVGGVPYIIEDNLTGILVNPKNDSGLAKTIILLLKDEKKRKELADAALDEIQRKYSTDVSIRKYGKIFRFLKRRMLR
jgi:glycosyltransferase involved in cell wall biosynthesis